MLAIAGQTVELNWHFTFYDGTLEYPCGNKGQNIFFQKLTVKLLQQRARRALKVIYHKTVICDKNKSILEE